METTDSHRDSKITPKALTPDGYLKPPRSLAKLLGLPPFATTVTQADDDYVDRRTVQHEAAHGVIAVVLEVPFRRIEVILRDASQSSVSTGALQFYRMPRGHPMKGAAVRRWANFIAVCLAGLEREVMLEYPTILQPAEDMTDLQEVWRLASALTARRRDHEQQREQCILAQQSHVRALLMRHDDAIDLVAGELACEGQLPAAKVREIVHSV